MTTVYTLRIDGKDVAGTEGQTILDVAERERDRHPDACATSTGISRPRRLPPVRGRDRRLDQARRRPA